MSVTYSITSKNGKISKFIEAACFANHYSVLHMYKSLTVHVDKAWMRERLPIKGYFGESAGWRSFSGDDYYEYVRLLKLMGMKFSFKEEDLQFLFVIDLSKNKYIANKLLLNAIRYLCEDPFPTIVESFLRLSKEKMPGVSMYNRFILAHQCRAMYHGGHTFIPSYTLPLLLSQKDFKDKLINNDENKTVTSQVPTCKKVFMQRDEDNLVKKNIDRRTPLFELFGKGALLKDILKEYKRLTKDLA